MLHLTIRFSYFLKFSASKVILVFLLVGANQFLRAGKTEIKLKLEPEVLAFATDTVYLVNVVTTENIDLRPNPLLHLFKAKQRKNKRIVASILAFPFPFGIVGLHRIYLGTAPHVPVVYIASLGGVLGILPFIDFCILMFDKDIDRYTENKKIFIWVD